MRRLLRGGLLLVVSLIGFQASAALVEGTDYVVLKPAQPTSDPNKIVVTEFFSYQCPHCYQFFPIVNAWVAKLPPDVAFERIPVSFGHPNWASIGQAYYALLAMDKLDAKLDAAIFNAIHAQNQKLGDMSSITDFLVKQGINGQEFVSVYNSFGVMNKMRSAEQAVPAYGVEGVPTLIIDGKYKVLGNDHEKQLAAANELISMVRSARKMPVPVAKAEPATAAPAVVATKTAIKKAPANTKQAKN
jgi:thiol:disulfide interchange protein DsbA